MEPFFEQIRMWDTMGKGYSLTDWMLSTDANIRVWIPNACDGIFESWQRI